MDEATVQRLIQEATVPLQTEITTLRELLKPEDIDVIGDTTVLKEGAVGQDGAALLKLIKDGWGSSGFYPRETLQRDGASCFPKGTKCFWDHPTQAEESARPEGSLNNLAAVLTEDAKWQDKGPAGPGLYAKANVFEHFRQPLDQLAKHIGMSIRAAGIAKPGKAEGRSGPIIEKLTRGISVDFVTTPGAGGQVLQLFEAARAVTTQEVPEMDKAEIQALITESQKPLLDEIKTLRETNAALVTTTSTQQQRVVEADAGVMVDGLLASLDIPAPAKKRTKEIVTGRVKEAIADGKIDSAKLKTMVDEVAASETKYIESLGPGIVRGLPGVQAPPTADEVKTREAVMRGSAENLSRLSGASRETAGKVVGIDMKGAA